MNTTKRRHRPHCGYCARDFKTKSELLSHRAVAHYCALCRKDSSETRFLNPESSLMVCRNCKATAA